MREKLDMSGIKQHWESLAGIFGETVNATTKTQTAKDIELHALEQTFKHLGLNLNSSLRILEAGCGNGINLFWLNSKFPELILTGFDYIPEMINSALSQKEKLKPSVDNLKFQLDSFETYSNKESKFDVVFTVRALINLNSDDLQKHAINKLSKELRAGGYLILLENSQQAHSDQNKHRINVGLPPREPAEYNHFINEKNFSEKLEGTDLNLLSVTDFIGIHDLLLYILVPLINGGAIDYENELVKSATRLVQSLNFDQLCKIGGFGQNRLFICVKK
jgi:SAM-dependent methyltransferase